MEPAETIQLAKLMDDRAGTYELLARLFREEADEALVESMHGALYPVSSGNASLDEGNRLVATYLSNLYADSVEELQIEYARCFIGSGVDAYTAAYPFESVYTSEKRLLMQDARDEVLAIYRSYGMECAESWNEGEDHVALELEFEASLCHKAAAALRDADEATALALAKAQLNFLDDHLVSWVPMMTSDLKKFATTEFYRGLAFLVEGFLEVDSELLRELLDNE